MRPAARCGSALRIVLLGVLLVGRTSILRADDEVPARGFDIAPFALPNPTPRELHFEEPRDVVAVDLTFTDDDGFPESGLGLAYWQQHWPGVKLEESADTTRPCSFGWTPSDDGLSGDWHEARTRIERLGARTVRITFEPLATEYPDRPDETVVFRRTVALKLRGVEPKRVASIRVMTRSAATSSTLRAEWAAPAGATLSWDGYNAKVTAVRPVSGCTVEGDTLHVSGGGPAVFELDVDHMAPAHRYSGDEGHVRFVLADDSFTVSLPSLERQGPVWFEEQGFYLTSKSDPTTSEAYLTRISDARTIAERVAAMPEQSYGGAYLGQPRPHAVAWSLGFKQARQRFWQDANGDLTVESRTVRQIRATDTDRLATDESGQGRFFFGLENWTTLGRWADPAPSLTYNLRVRRNDIELVQTSLAAPLDGRVFDGPIVGERDLVALVRFELKNVGPMKQTARLALDYSPDSDRTGRVYPDGHNEDWKVPGGPREALTLDGPWIRGRWNDRDVLRARVETTMMGRRTGSGLVFERELEPDASCVLVLKVPFVALDRPEELEAVARLEDQDLRRQLASFWRREVGRGAQIRTPVPQMDALHQSHLAYVQISDPAMPGAPELVNTSVGTSTYSNCGNESCMILEELDQRGLPDEARKRLAVFTKYQGTEPLVGQYSDHEGVFHGAGGYTFLGSYNQNHGWILWRLAEHYAYTRDRTWLDQVAPNLIAGCDWVFRQRRHTMGDDRADSRGWERGFLPPGGLEDVAELRYWLTSNAMIWRGVDAAAAVLEETGHPEGARIRREADAYAGDLRRGFETMRQHCPLVRLRNGRWVPYYSTHIYGRGRDVGWIRETLEGSLYLILSGLYDPKSPQARWILDDYEDNRLMNPPYGYSLNDEENEWFARGGISIQPNLLATLMPYLDRDEVEVYLWTFFNAWAACYREEANLMVEHPMPVLGYNNTAHPKTSDEANAVMWLRYLFVYGPKDGLYLGRAIPRAWLAQAEPIGLDRVHTRWGVASVSFTPDPDANTIRAHVDLTLHATPPKIVLRFRHPEGKPIQSVRLNGQPHAGFDPDRGDVDLTGVAGSLDVEARY
jgi:hypothetical protein